jgi:hypothetical protein
MVGRSIRIAAIVAIGAVAATALLVFGGMALLDSLGFLPREYPGNVQAMEQFSSIEVGMSEAQVLAKLGSPGSVYGPGTRPEEYHVSGYPYEKRRVTGKLLIFSGGADVLAYVYIDTAGKVEHVYVCQS